MSHRHFMGEVTLVIRGKILDFDEPQVSSEVDVTYAGKLKAQHGMGAHDILSGWIVTGINGSELLVPTYADGFVKAIGQLVTAATDPGHRLHAALNRLMRAGRLCNGDANGSGAEDGQGGAGAALRRPADDRLSAEVPGKLSSDARPVRRRGAR